jgi:hypothetical protein
MPSDSSFIIFMFYNFFSLPCFYPTCESIIVAYPDNSLPNTWQRSEILVGTLEDDFITYESFALAKWGSKKIVSAIKKRKNKELMYTSFVQYFAGSFKLPAN